MSCFFTTAFTNMDYLIWSSVYPNILEEGCPQSFLSLLRERALCVLCLYRSLDRRNSETQNIRDEVHADTGFKGEQSLQ